MGHEIAHAIVGHGKERMSQAKATQFGSQVPSAALSISKTSSLTQSLLGQAYGMGTQYRVLLPYSRLHGTEADKLGLIFMTMAGYDPNAAVSFWERMSQNSGGSAPIEILSTHPADKTRIDDLKKFISEALSYKK